jgi:iron complex transport system substrate-binding protein
MNRKGPNCINALAGLLGLAIHATACAAADAPQRVVSINLCTDQLLLALAEPSQIAGLGRFAWRKETSFLADRALNYPSLRGTAEEVLLRRPDLVLAGAFSGRATRDVLQAHGIRVETFVPPRNLGEAKAEAERVAALLGQDQRGARLVADIDAALAAAMDAARARPRLTALAIERRGFASGRDTLLSSVMQVAGLANAADALGLTSIVRVPLETMLKLRPDVLVMEEAAEARDQSTAVLRHPALAHAFSTSRIITLPVPELNCAGPALPALVRDLTAKLAALPLAH